MNKVGGKQCGPTARTSVPCYSDGDGFNLLVFSLVEERMCCTKLLSDFMYYAVAVQISKRYSSSCHVFSSM